MLVIPCWPLTNISWDESGSKPIKTWPSGIHGNKQRGSVFVYPQLPSGLCLLCFLQVSESWRHTTLLLHTHNRKCRRASSHTWKTHKHKHTCALWGQTGISTHQVLPPGVHLHLTSDSEHSLKPLPLTIVQSQQRTDQSTWDPDVSLTCPIIQHQPDQYREWSQTKSPIINLNNLFRWKFSLLTSLERFKSQKHVNMMLENIIARHQATDCSTKPAGRHGENYRPVQTVS